MEDLANFAAQAQGATFRCNIDKSSLGQYLAPEVVKKCKWYQVGCKESK